MPPRFDPASGEELVTGIRIDTAKKTNPYRAEFRFNKKKVNAGNHASPALALIALNKRKAECEADPSSAIGAPKVERPLQKGVYKGGKRNKLNSFRGKFSHHGKTIFCGDFSTPELAFTAVNAKRATLNLAAYPTKIFLPPLGPPMPPIPSSSSTELMKSV